MAEPVAHEGRCRVLDWAACATPYPGEERSGDAFLVEESPDGLLVAVVDGLGHGEEAADVADLALATLRETSRRSPMAYLTACHEALRGSRGAAMTLAVVDSDNRRLAWVAVGNVEAVVMRRGRGGGRSTRWSVPLRGGIVGTRLPVVRESAVCLEAGDVLISATDGVAPGFLDGVDLSLPAPVLARRLHGRYVRADDDALMLVARFGADWDGRQPRSV